MKRERMYITLSDTSLTAIRAMSEELHMNMCDVVEVIIAVYFEYIMFVKKRQRGQK